MSYKYSPKQIVTDSTVKAPDGKTYVVLPFNKIRKYNNRYMLTQTNTISNEKYIEYTSANFSPENLTDYYYYLRINQPDTTLPIKVPLEVCKTMVRNLTIKAERKFRDVSTSLFVNKESYDTAISEIIGDITRSSEIFSFDTIDEVKLFESYDTDTICDSSSANRAFSIDIRRANDILSNLKKRQSSDLYIYSGGPGCGKTYQCIQKLKERNFKKILVTSLSNIVGLRFLARLGLRGSQQWSFSKVAFSQAEKLSEFDAIVVEEASMISSSEFVAIRKLVSANLPIFFLGDPYQLPGFTGLGNLFVTLLKEFKANTVYLTTQHRMNTDLCDTVDRIKQTGFLPKSKLSSVEAYSTFVNWVSQGLDTAAITYRNKDCLEINDLILDLCYGMKSKYYDAQTDKDGDVDPKRWEAVLTEAAVSGISLRVVSITNVSRKDGKSFNRILSNGEQGVLRPDALGGFEFESKENGAKTTWTLKDVMINFRLGYAMTIHKAQGSEWDKVFYLEPRQDRYMQYSLNHRYVAVTRARDELIWCDKNSRPVQNKFLTFNHIINNQRI